MLQSLYLCDLMMSGLSGTKESAQSRVLVGIGLLAGSTVMLLTVIWGSCIIVGKHDIEHSVAEDGQNTKGFSLTETGVCTDISTCYTAKIMAISVIPFIVVQIPQILHSTSGRNLAVLIALIVSVLMFIAYCLYQVFQPSYQGLSSVEDGAAGRLLEGAETNQENQTCDVENPKSIYFKAVLMLIIGTIFAAAFAHPLVDAVTNFSNATYIPPFFVSFIALPMATKLSVVVPLLIDASHKNRTASSTFIKLYTTVSTDNVIYLSVFLAIVYIRGLSWDFSAEVLAIAVVCILVGGFASVRTTFPLWTCLLAYMLYPLSLALVYVLDYVLGWA